MKPPGALGDSATRVLLAVIGGHVRHPDIRRATGLSRSYVHAILDRLEAEGLVRWERGRLGTLRATCTRHGERRFDTSATLGPDNLSGRGAAQTAPGPAGTHTGGADMAGPYPGAAAPDQGAA